MGNLSTHCNCRLKPHSPMMRNFKIQSICPQANMEVLTHKHTYASTTSPFAGILSDIRLSGMGVVREGIPLFDMFRSTGLANQDRPSANLKSDKLYCNRDGIFSIWSCPAIMGRFRPSLYRNCFRKVFLSLMINPEYAENICIKKYALPSQ